MSSTTAIMKILASGMGGSIGQELLPALVGAGHTVMRLKTGSVRGENEIVWNPLAPIAPATVSGFDAVIHLAGENIMGRWSAAKKQRIHASRVEGTRNLCAALAACAAKPKVLLAASAVGFYGNKRGDDILNEQSNSGTGFLAASCREWEAATEAARAAGIRVVNLRFGVVLSAKSGALKKMLAPFKLGLGGKIGSGKQWMSWVAISDAVAAILVCLNSDSVSGPVNIVAPEPVTNAEFAKTLGKTLHRPAFATAPAFVARMLLGPEMAEETVLSSERVVPGKLLAGGFRFQHPELGDALRALLSETRT